MNIRFDEKGLVPAIVQDAETKEVLTLSVYESGITDKNN